MRSLLDRVAQMSTPWGYSTSFPPVKPARFNVAVLAQDEGVTTTSAPLHPRPQFARAAWTELDGAWQLAYDDACVGLD
jgi:hypothetical protein